MPSNTLSTPFNNVPEPSLEAVQKLKRRPSKAPPPEPSWLLSHELCERLHLAKKRMLVHPNQYEGFVTTITDGLSPDESNQFQEEIDAAEDDLEAIQMIFLKRIHIVLNRELGPAIDECDVILDFLETVRDHCLHEDAGKNIRTSVKHRGNIKGLDLSELMERIHEQPFNQTDILESIQELLKGTHATRKELANTFNALANDAS